MALARIFALKPLARRAPYEQVKDEKFKTLK